MADKARLTLDLDPKLHKRLKMLAASKGITMREFCIDAIKLRVREGKEDYLTVEEAPLLAELWDNEEDAVYDNL
jgi:hypothetical protein